MTNLQRRSLGERNTEQAITALKRGSYLLKYGRRGKPKFCPFRLSQDETALFWYVGKEEKQLCLSQVSRIIPGQRTAVFQRYPRPEKEYQSFSLIYGNRSLDLICKDKEEAETWFAALRALVSRGNYQKWRNEIRNNGESPDNSSVLTQLDSQSILSNGSGDTVYEEQQNTQLIPAPSKAPQRKTLGRVFSDILIYNSSPRKEFVGSSHTSPSCGILEDINGRISADTVRTSFSSGLSSCSLESSFEEISNLTDIFIWGQGTGNGLLGGGVHDFKRLSGVRINSSLPKALESALVLDAQNIACGSEHAVLITGQGEIFSWGEGSGGRLGHGFEADVSNPILIDTLSGQNIVSVACGEYHTCAVTQCGDLYTWGDGIHNIGLLGHGTEISYWTPRKVRGPMDSIHVTSVSCGPWHSALITSVGQLYTFGDGSFGALGHGDRCCAYAPREVEILKGVKALRVSCGYWHTAAIVEATYESSSSGASPNGKLFTWGNGDDGQLGHGDKQYRLVPCRVSMPNDTSFSQVACGASITVALTTSGHVYAMGNINCGQVGNLYCTSLLPIHVQGAMKSSFIGEISCGSNHVVALSTKSEVYSWGKGRNGQLGHGDNADRSTPTLVEALRGKHVKRIICGRNFTAAICLHKQISIADHSFCSGCRMPFNFGRKRCNCYNCGLLFCKACSSKKSVKASLAPDSNKPYRVCEDCFTKLKKSLDTGLMCRPPKATNYIQRDITTAELTKSKPGLFSRFSSINSFRRANSFHSKKTQKLESNIGRVSPLHNGNRECDMSYASSPSSSVFDHSSNVNFTDPASPISSRAASPASGKSSSSRAISLASAFACLSCPEKSTHDAKQTNDALIKEISVLREQLQALTHRSEYLTAELERTAKQLNEATELAQYESEKNSAAKEVIKCLLKQLKDLALGVPQASSCRTSSPFADRMSNSLDNASTWSQLTG